MNDPLKKTKSRLDLMPWNEFNTIAIDHSVEAVYEGLKRWWSARGFPLELSIPRRQIPGVARVLGRGALKHGERNWEQGIPYSVVFGAACRHAEAVMAGDLVDDGPEGDGLAHESHFWCNVLFLVVFHARGREDLDDRPPAVPEVLNELQSLAARMDQLRAGLGMSEPAPETPKRGEAN